jgi:hypothetical protein
MERRIRLLLAVGAMLVGGVDLSAQKAAEIPLFASHEPIQFTLTADFHALKGDRRGDTPERPATLVMEGDDGQEVSLDVKLRTRGGFRRAASNCTLPPLRFNFKKKQVEGTVFEGQDKMKVVGSCRPNRDSFEQLVLNEYLAYRAFQEVSPAAFQVRLARITYVDSSGDTDPFTRFAFFIEDDDAMAQRFGARVLDLTGQNTVPPGALDPALAATTAIFQYMIGNTDWSDAAGHNTEVLDMGGIGIPVPYDFDFSGIVDAPYSLPDPSLYLESVRDRRYRGWCFPGLNTGSVLARFREAESDIMALYRGFPHLTDGERNRAVDYLEGFFKAIETDERAERRFLGYCRALPIRTASRD